MKTVVYGTGKRFDDLFDYRENVDLGIIANEIDIVGFSDTNPELWGKEILYNDRVFFVKSIQDFSVDEFEKIMITTNAYFDEIREMLVCEGYKAEQIFLIDDIFESYHELIGYGDYKFLKSSWMESYEQLKDVSFFFEAGGYRDIAVYGTGPVAKSLIHTMRRVGVRIMYLVDTNITSELEGIPIYEAEEELPMVDLIIVADCENYMDVEKRLCEKNLIEVISMQELIYKTLKNCQKEKRICATLS